MTYHCNEDYLESSDFPFHVVPYFLDSNRQVLPHAHEFIEFVYIADGHGEHQYQEQSYSISKGDIFVIEPDTEHAYRVPDHSFLHVFNVLFHPSFLSTELQIMSEVTPFVNFFYVEPFLRQSLDFQSHLTLTPDEEIEVKHYIERMLNEYKTKRLGYRIVIKALLIELFICLSRCYDNSVHQPMTSLADEEKVIYRIREFIELHHARPLTLEQVCMLCGMSHSTFTLKFKKYVGKTFIEFRNEVRMKTAKELLERTDDKIIYVSQQVGFEDLSYFNKKFRQFFGMSPGKFRNITKEFE